jgi:hypothetical protein
MEAAGEIPQGWCLRLVLSRKETAMLSCPKNGTPHSLKAADKPGRDTHA